MSLEELALAYELRQEGCCWKRIAQGLGGDARLICAQISYLVRNGIQKGLNGYPRKTGRQAAFHMDTIKHAHVLHVRGSSWEGIGRELGVDSNKIRKAYRYALNNNMIGVIA